MQKKMIAMTGTTKWKAEEACLSSISGYNQYNHMIT